MIDTVGYPGLTGFRYPAASELVSDPVQQSQNGGASLVTQSRSPLKKVLQQTLSELAGSNCSDPMVRSAVVDAELSVAASTHAGSDQTDELTCTSQLFSLVCRALALSGSGVSPETDDTFGRSGDTEFSDTIASPHTNSTMPVDGMSDGTPARDTRDTLTGYASSGGQKAVGVLIDLVA
jgi:hypothetical protein